MPMSDKNNSQNKKFSQITGERNEFSVPGSTLSLSDLRTASFSDVSKYFKSASSCDLTHHLNGSSVSEIKSREETVNVLNNEVISNTSDHTKETLVDVEKQSRNFCLRFLPKKTMSSKFKNITQLQWFKILGLSFIIIGGVVGVITQTIFAIQNEHSSDRRKENKFKFGKQFTNLLSVRADMVDPDTPKKFYFWNSSTNEEWDLVFSDEFNCEERTFYPGDDQFWEAMDIYYAATNNLEWLDPSHVTTKEGSLRITLDDTPSHGLNYTSGMIQSWNKMCFTQGYVETSIKLPGTKKSRGIWPAFWALGNLARAGYMATTDGTWPYSYDGCDLGVTPNQSSSDGLSLLPGQRLNACVCEGEDHPNPGTGRAAPEIDILEGLYNDVIQTFNIAPFDTWRYPDYEHIAVSNFSTSAMNKFMGTNLQEAVSVIITNNPQWFEKGNFIKFGMEYRADMENRMHNYINFYINDQMTFRVTEGAFHPDGNINWRQIPREPMSLIINLGLSKSWSNIDFDTIDFPVYMDVDYVRIYQPKGKHSLTCDPEDYPTSKYINDHYNAYYNPNLTSWKQAGYAFPEYSLDNQCGA